METGSLIRQWFAEPRLLWLLAGLPVLGLLGLWAKRCRRRALAALGGGAAFAALRTRSRQRGPWLFLSLWLGLTVLIVAAAGPQWGRDWSQTATIGRDVVVVLDLSRSMQAESTSRREQAREALLDVEKEIRRRGGHRIGLVVFAGQARLVCPLTHDYDHFRHTVETLNESGVDHRIKATEDSPSGTRIGAGLEAAVSAHAAEATGVQDILLLSDGDDPAEDGEWREGLATAQARRIPVFVAGVGNPERKTPLTVAGSEVQTRLEEGPLQEIADGSGGEYVRLRKLQESKNQLGTWYLERVAKRGEHEHGVDALPVYRRRAEWFLLAAFAMLTASLFLGEGRRTS